MGRKQYSANLGSRDAVIVWDGVDSAIGWLDQLLSEWAWLSAPNVRRVCGGKVWDKVLQPISHLRVQLEQAKGGQVDDMLLDQTITSVGSQLSAQFQSQPWLSRRSAERAFLDDLQVRKGPVIASALLGIWLKLPFTDSDNSFAIAQASVEAALFELGSPKRLTWEADSYKQILANLENDRVELRKAVDAAERQRSSQFDGFTETEKQRATAFEAAEARREGEWVAKANGFEAEMQNLKDAYDKHMSLAAPVEYWETKQKRHFKWMVVTGVATALGMVAAGALLHWELSAVAQQATSTSSQTKEGVVGVLSAIATWRLGSFLLLATLAFWVLRLLVRVFLSNLHLENDAAERVTMVKTYLALIRDGKLSSDSENLKAVLAALFRPTGDGIVKDEGIPPNMLELLTKLK